MADAAMFRHGPVDRDTPVIERGASKDFRQEEKISLQGSVMLVVLGSGGCWFGLTAMMRWMFF